MSHTIGPWRVVDRRGRGLHIEWGGAADGVERPVALMRWTDGLRSDVSARVLSDAHMLAAAPAMFAVLRVLEEYPRDVPLTRDIRQMIIAAITKAKGDL